jgi:hypothetical protein
MPVLLAFRYALLDGSNTTKFKITGGVTEIFSTATVRERLGKTYILQILHVWSTAHQVFLSR